MMRLNKYIAHCGICSRRKAVDLIKNGEIKVNGIVETNPAVEITDKEEVIYQDKVIKLEQKLVYILMNKPKGVVTTLNDEEGRRTVIDMLGDKVTERVYPVGRLDMNTVGLLLITNDGDLANKLSHPSNEVNKVYHIHLFNPLAEADFKKIKNGIILEDGMFQSDKVSILNEDRTEIGLEIHSGRNRIIRRVFEKLNHDIKVLDRVYYAGLTKKDLPRGWTRMLSQEEVIKLKHFKA